MTLPPLPLLPEAASDEYSLWVPYEGAQTIHRDVYTDEQMESYATTYAEQRQSASGARSNWTRWAATTVRRRCVGHNA